MNLAPFDALALCRETARAANSARAAKAWAWAEAEGLVATKGGDRKSKYKNSDLISAHFAAMFGVNRIYVEQARALLNYDPPAAAEVEAGRAMLKEKYDALAERQRESMTAEGRLRKLSAAKTGPRPAPWK